MSRGVLEIWLDSEHQAMTRSADKPRPLGRGRIGPSQ